MAVVLKTAESVDAVLTCPSMEDQGHKKKFARKLMLLKNGVVIDFTN